MRRQTGIKRSICSYKKKISLASNSLINENLEQYKAICTALEIDYDETANEQELINKIKVLELSQEKLENLTVAQLKIVASDVFGIKLTKTIKAEIITEILAEYNQ